MIQQKLNKVLTFQQKNLEVPLDIPEKELITVLSQITKREKLQDLQFTESKLTEKVGEGIGKVLSDENLALKTLILKDIDISNGLEHVVNGVIKNKSLYYFCISECKFSDDNLKTLQKLFNESSITDFSFKDLLLNDEHVKTIFQDIPQDRFVKKVSLRNNKLVDCGPHLCKTLLSTPSLTHLSLNQNTLDYNSISSIFRHLETNQNLTFLDISENKLLFDQDLSKSLENFITKNHHLKSIGLAGNLLTSDTYEAFGSSLTKNNSLESLILANIAMKDEDLKLMENGLKHNRSLKHLDIKKNYLTSKSCITIGDILHSNKSIQKLELPCKCFITNLDNDFKENFSYIFESLEKNRSLSYIDASKTQLNDESLSKFYKASNLHTFIISQNNFTDVGAKFIINALSNNPNLSFERLSFGRNNFSKELFDEIYRLIHLNDIYQIYIKQFPQGVEIKSQFNDIFYNFE